MFEIQQEDALLGATILGIDLTYDLSDKEVAFINEALAVHQVIFFRNQHLSSNDHRRLALKFGNLQTHPAYRTVDDLPEVMILESTPENPSKIEAWHSDMTFRQHPPSVTVLRGITIPEVGGDTLFASMTAAYDGLSQGMQRYLDGLIAVHDFSHGFKESLSESGGRDRLADAVATNPPVRHPVVQVHPETGKKVLFVNALFTTHIVGLPPLESAEVLQFLWRHASLPEFSCRFHWQPDSMVIWDNRSTQHKPVNDFFPAIRRLHRVVSEGDRPY